MSQKLRQKLIKRIEADAFRRAKALGLARYPSQMRVTVNIMNWGGADSLTASDWKRLLSLNITEPQRNALKRVKKSKTDVEIAWSDLSSADATSLALIIKKSASPLHLKLSFAGRGSVIEIIKRFRPYSKIRSWK